MAKRVLTPEDWHVLTLPFDYGYYYSLRKGMEEGDEKASCTFCHRDPVQNPVLYETDDWWVTPNAHPNDRACEVMLLIVSKEHWRKLDEITPRGWKSLGKAVECINDDDRFDLPGGMLFLRFGDMALNGGTMRHLHINIWVPDKSRKVWAPIYKSPEEIKADQLRTAEYAKRYEAGEVP